MTIQQCSREEGFEERAVGRDPERMITRREDGWAFHREVPIVAKDLVWATVVLTRGTKRVCLTKERRSRRETEERGERMIP